MVSWFKSRGEPKEPPVELDPPGLWAWVNEPLSSDARNIIARVARSAAKDALEEILSTYAEHPEMLLGQTVIKQIETLIHATVNDQLYGNPPYSKFHELLKADRDRKGNE